ncbi:unnamed protein product [Amoebophrya sp. A120]|nr:unnamed protein product [Amoebophrya sp. A120]|eukprot:GSA120T00001832001.1
MKLVVFLRKLANESVSVDLKSNVKVDGTIIGVDMQMNIHMKNVKVTSPGREAAPMEHLTLRGNTIRSVCLPDNLALETLLTEKEPRRKRPAGKGKGKAGGRGAGFPIKNKMITN